jgi:putative SOS response-associated peptidase YedK
VPATFKARVETNSDKPTFRESLQRRHCIIPSSGFYEWTGEKKDRQPDLFTAADGSPILAFAGLWDRWRDPGSGEEVLSCAIIVSIVSMGHPVGPCQRDASDRNPIVNRRRWPRDP